MVVSLATVALYWYSFCFEVGYAWYFGYPSGLIPITLGLVLNVWTLLFIYTVAIFQFLQLNLFYWPHHGKWKYGLVFAFILWFASIIVIRAYAPFYAIPGAGLLAVVAAYVAIVMKRRSSAEPTHKGELKDDSDLKQIAMVYDARSELPPDSVAYKIVKGFGFDPVLLLLLIVVVFPGVFAAAGIAEARAEQDFYTFTESGSSREYIVLRILDGLAIAAPYDPTTEACQKRFLVRKVAEVPDLVPTHIDRLSCSDPFEKAEVVSQMSAVQVDEGKAVARS